MPVVQDPLLTWAAVATGCILFQVAAAATTASGIAAGYMQLALLRKGHLLLLGVFVESLLGTIICFAIPERAAELTVSHLLVGALVGSLSYLAYQLSYRQITVDNARSMYMRTLRLFGSKYRAIAETVQRQINEDNYDCLHGNGDWGAYPVRRTDRGRRVRLLFANSKLEIASSRRDPRILSMDVGVLPQQLFYLLVRFYGRDALVSLLSSSIPSPPPGYNWNGSERRRYAGTIADRASSREGPPRVSDVQSVIEQVRRGEAWPGKGRP